MGLTFCENKKTIDNVEKQKEAVVDILPKDTVLLSVNIKDIPPQLENITVSLEYFYQENIESFESVELNKNEGVVSFKIPPELKGVFFVKINDTKAFDILIGYEDKVEVFANYHSFIEKGDAKVISHENDLYKQVKRITEQQRNTDDSLAAVNKQLSYVEKHYKLKQEELRNKSEVIQKSADSILVNLAKNNKSTFVSQSLIPTYRLPIRNKESEYDNDRSYLHYHYFDNIPLENKGIMYVPEFRRYLHNYLVYYAGNSEEEMQNASVRFLLGRNMDEEVKQFITNYFVGYCVKTQRTSTARFILENTIDGCENDMLENMDQYIEFSKGLALNTSIPNLSIHSKEGKEIQLHKQLKDKEYTFLYVWKSGCEECIEEHNKIKKAYTGLLANNIQVIGISVDDDLTEFNETLQTYNMTWQNFFEDKEARAELIKQLKIVSTPSTFLINSNAILLQKNLDINQVFEYI